MNLRAVLVHRGQTVDRDGVVHGELPETDTLGFRWNAFNNLFWTAGDVGAKEWQARFVTRTEDAEKELRQFYWAIPYDPPEVTMTPLQPEDILRRATGTKRGIIPDGTTAIAVGIDTGKWRLHWVAVALRANGGGTVLEYDSQVVESDRLGLRAGLVDALGKLRTYFDSGWPDMGGQLYVPQQVWIDCGYYEHTDAVYEFCRDANPGLNIGNARYRPAKGYGADQQFATRYATPREVNHEVRWIGEEFHLSMLARAQQFLVHVNADHWKSKLHQALAMPADQAKAVMLYEAADSMEHLEYSEHLTAEEQREVIDARGRPAVVGVRVRRKNHLLDASYTALAASHFVLETQRIAAEEAKAAKGPRPPVTTPDGRPYFLLDR
jgi:hypothetical protein